MTKQTHKTKQYSYELLIHLANKLHPKKKKKWRWAPWICDVIKYNIYILKVYKGQDLKEKPTNHKSML